MEDVWCNAPIAVCATRSKNQKEHTHTFLEVGCFMQKWLFNASDMIKTREQNIEQVADVGPPRSKESTLKFKKSCVRSGLNSHYFHIIGDGYQPNSRGL